MLIAHAGEEHSESNTQLQTTTTKPDVVFNGDKPPAVSPLIFGAGIVLVVIVVLVANSYLDRKPKA